MTPILSLELEAVPGAPEFGVTPQISPFGFRGSEFFFTISNARWSLRKLGPNSRLAGGILPPNPKNPKLSRAFRESRWSYLVKIKNLHTSHIGLPLLNFFWGAASD